MRTWTSRRSASTSGRSAGGAAGPSSPSCTAPTAPEIPKSVVDCYDANEKNRAARERKALVLQTLTLAVIIVYTAITFVQWCAVLHSNRLTARNIEMANRAWVLVADLTQIPK